MDKPEIVRIAYRYWVIEHIDLNGETYYGCGILPLRRDRAELLKDIERSQGPEWRK